MKIFLRKNRSRSSVEVDDIFGSIADWVCWITFGAWVCDDCDVRIEVVFANGEIPGWFLCGRRAEENPVVRFEVFFDTSGT